MSRTIRPPQAVLVAVGVLAALVVGLCAREALRTGDYRLIWLGAGLAIMTLPAVAWCRGSVTIEEAGLVQRGFGWTLELPFAEIAGYGFRTVTGNRGSTRWLVLLGRDGRRMEIAVSHLRRSDGEAVLAALHRAAPQAPVVEVSGPSQWSLALLMFATLAALFFCVVVLDVFAERTLGEATLFNGAALLGLVGGAALGAAWGPRLFRRSPISLVTAAALLGMVACPAAALAANAFVRRPGRTEEMTVLSKKMIPQKHGVAYEVELTVAGIPKRLSPGRRLWDALPASGTLPVCLIDGRLGYPVVVYWDRPCPLVAARR